MPDLENIWGRFLDFLKRFFPNWIHIVIKVPIILFILYHLINAGLYVSSTPTFCRTFCHEMQMYARAWDKSSHAKIGCYTCHGHRDFIGKILGKVESLKELYYHILKIYEYPIISKKFTSDHSCHYCHSENRKYTLPGDLIDPHEKHKDIKANSVLKVSAFGEVHNVEFTGQECVYCHFNVVHEKSVLKRRPQMEFCYDNCHNGKDAPDKCDACHTNKPLPESHKAKDWYQIHGKLAEKENCAACHQWREENFCKACHKIRPRSHTPKVWKSTHKERAKVNKEGCKACHTNDFCLECHGVLP